MSEQVITKAQLDELLAPLIKLVTTRVPDGSVSPTSFHTPVTSTTSVEVKFHGPVGIEEYDALMAQLHTYKQLLPKKNEPKLNTVDTVEAIRKAVDRIWEDREERAA